MTAKRDPRNNADAVTLAAIQAGVPSLVQALALVERFHAMIRKKEDGDLDPWVAEARGSLLSSFAAGIAKDSSAVRAAITEPWSNGQVEAQITKLKLVKRQMYGRANLDLLQARLLGAPEPSSHHQM
jgi:transposase